MPTITNKLHKQLVSIVAIWQQASLLYKTSMVHTQASHTHSTTLLSLTQHIWKTETAKTTSTQLVSLKKPFRRDLHWSGLVLEAAFRRTNQTDHCAPGSVIVLLYCMIQMIQVVNWLIESLNIKHAKGGTVKLFYKTSSSFRACPITWHTRETRKSLNALHVTEFVSSPLRGI